MGDGAAGTSELVFCEAFQVLLFIAALQNPEDCWTSLEIPPFYHFKPDFFSHLIAAETETFHFESVLGFKTTCFVSWCNRIKAIQQRSATFWMMFSPEEAAAADNEVFFPAFSKRLFPPSGGTLSHQLVNMPHHHHKRFHQNFVGTDQIAGARVKTQLDRRRSLMKKGERFFSPKCLLTPYFPPFFPRLWFVVTDGRHSENSPPSSLACGENGRRTETDDMLGK